MLILMQRGASARDIEHVQARIRELGYQPQSIETVSRTVVSIGEANGSLDPEKFSQLAGVERIARILTPYKLASREFRREPTIVDVGGAQIGQGRKLAIVGGPCAFESREQALETAKTVLAGGARFMRGGLYKPRTSPFSFQGLGREGLGIAREVRAMGLKLVTEALDEESLEVVAQCADVVQVGARNMQNFALLKKVARTGLPVLLKRGMSATLDELLMAADYLLMGGNENVILCERGIKTFARHTRNTLDLSIVPAIHELSHLPVVVDPSHGTGKAAYVGELALAAVAVGADGVMIETHPDPVKALSDGYQALRPLEFLELLARVRAVAKAVGREV